MKSRLSVLLAAACTVAATFVAVAPQAGAGGEPPVLWEGEVRDVYGKGAPAEVVAFLRPPPALLVPNAPLVALASTTTDGAGRFVLRATPTAAFGAITDEAGWGTLLLATFGAGDVELAVDSVAWKGGRWITSPSEMAGHEATARDLLAERPDIIKLSTSRAFAGKGTPPPNAGSCWARERPTDKGDHWTTVGELHLNTGWGGQFKYTNTNTTSFQVGLQENRGPWKISGSVSWSKQDEVSQEKHPIPPAPTSRMWQFDAKLDFMQFEWACNKSYPNVYEASTFEPTDWTTAMRERTDVTAPGCKQQHKVQVLPTGDYTRVEGSSLTLAGAISAGPIGGAMTSAASKSVLYKWSNHEPRHRFVCGATADPRSDTRISSLP